jgi:F0F1-type ATP synthase membrane subunit b/b'
VIQSDLYVKIAIWSQVVSALLFMCVLIWLWFKYIQPAILTAQDRQNKQIAEAERHRDEAKAMLDLLRNDIESASHDAEAIKTRVDVQAAREFEGIVTEAREAGEHGVRGAQASFSGMLAAARDRFRGEMLDKALARARIEATSRVDDALDARLVDGFAASLERPNV